MLIFSALIWAGVYARKQGFTASWRAVVENELAEQGYYIDIGKLTLGAFRGLVAEDVTFFRDEARTEAFAELNDIFLDVGLGRILEKEISVNTLDIQNGRLTIPLNPEKANEKGAIQVTNLFGKIALTESRVEVVRLIANLAGVEISIKGSLLRPPDLLNTKIKDAGKEAFEATISKVRALKSVIDAVETFDFGDGTPTLKVEFEGDLRDLSESTAQAVLKGGRFRKKGGGYEVTSLNVLADFDGRIGQIKIPHLELTDSLGSFDADAVLNRNTNELKFDATSSADLINLLEFFFPNQRWGEVVIYQPPKVRAEGTIHLGKINEKHPGFYFPGQIIGDFQTEGFVVSGGVFFAGSSGEFSVKEDGFYLRNIRADHKTGVALLNCKYAPKLGANSFQFQSAVKMDPRVFAPLLKDENTQRFLQKWSFDDNSGVHLEASGQSSSLDLTDLRAKGLIDLRNFKLNEIPFLELETQFEIDGGERWYRDVTMKREDGEVGAMLVYNHSEKKLWEIKGGNSTVDLIEGFRAFSPVLQRFLSPFRFTVSPTMKVQGVIDGRPESLRADSESVTDLEVSFSSAEAVKYSFLGKELPVSSAEAMIFIKNDRLKLQEFKANLYGGSLTVNFETPDFRGPEVFYDASMNLVGASLKSLGASYGIGEAATGEFDVNFKFSGEMSKPQKIHGAGMISVADQDLFQIPLFTGLEDLLVNHEPGHNRGNNSTERSQAAFQIKDGVIKSSSLNLVPGTVGLRGNATIHMPDKKIEVELSPAQGSETRTYRCKGTLDSPVWKVETGKSGECLTN